MTIASSVETDKELDRLEARHICPERALADLLELEKAIVSRSRQTTLH
jgi:hypothetical protein